MTGEQVDVLIVGAGLSGIGAACHLLDERPGTSFAIVEARDVIGGTWDLFRYPGVRSDSDMYTLGYRFRPWTDPKSIVDGPSIRQYIRDTAREYGVDNRIRYRHRVVEANWSSTDARWQVRVERTDTGELVDFECRFLFACTGYYDYAEGYTPELPGIGGFEGQVVHPQHWPEDLAYQGKKVIVIGSGATAVTLVPALAGDAGHVTMLQRSPSYFAALPGTDPVAQALHGKLPERLLYSAVRWKSALLTTASYQLSRRAPKLMKALLRKGVERLLPAGFDVDTHFTPRYQPWDERLCIVPDGDLFRAIRRGTASVVTGRIDTFTATGIRLTDGTELDADIVVTATGLNLLAIGGITLHVDGEPVELAKRMAYKGMMLSGVPNFALTVGYTNASWTLKADLVAHYVCRLLGHLAEHGYDTVVPEPPADADGWADAPLIDLKSGYVRRGAHLLPRQGPVAPWRLYQNYLRDVLLLRQGPVTGDGIRFASTRSARREPVR